jgi:hypothetical protein
MMFRFDSKAIEAHPEPQNRFSDHLLCGARETLCFLFRDEFAEKQWEKDDGHMREKRIKKEPVGRRKWMR